MVHDWLREHAALHRVLWHRLCVRLTEAEFTILVDAGCKTCMAKKLEIETLVAQSLPLYGGEVYGATSWAYKGEALVEGTYRITCKG